MNRRSFLQATGNTIALQILVSHRACLNAQGAQPGSAVETMLGRVRGLASPGVIAFKGLRYGASTAGANRFQPPVKPAYLYYFNWRSPVRNGKLRTMHGMELPFVFDHPGKISFMTGAGSDRAAIATAMSSAWVAFARTGNPNHSGIPQWAAFNPTTWPTMVFGSRTRAENDPWGAERKAMAAARVKQL